MALIFSAAKGFEFNTEKEHVHISDISINDGVATVTKTIYLTFKRTDGGLLTAEDYASAKFEARKSNFFPKKYSALAQDASFHFTGNGTISMWKDTSGIVILDLEYSNGQNYSGHSSSDGKEKAPWELGVTEYDFTPEQKIVPFVTGYDEDGNEIALTNTAGDPIIAEKEVYATVMKFTYCLQEKDWKEEYAAQYVDTVNSRKTKVGGVTIDGKKALLRDISSKFLTTYDDDGKEKWRYWQISVSIVAGKHITEFLNIGNRAYFKNLDYKDDFTGVSLILNGTKDKETEKEIPQMIVRWRKYKKQMITGSKYKFCQLGDNIIASWGQFLEFREWVIMQAQKLQDMDSSYEGGIPEPQYEVLTDMPLTNTPADKWGQNASKGYVDEEAIEKKKYPKIKVYKREPKSWTALNMPKER